MKQIDQGKTYNGKYVFNRGWSDKHQAYVVEFQYQNGGDYVAVGPTQSEADEEFFWFEFNL